MICTKCQSQFSGEHDCTFIFLGFKLKKIPFLKLCQWHYDNRRTLTSVQAFIAIADHLKIPFEILKDDPPRCVGTQCICSKNTGSTSSFKNVFGIDDVDSFFEVFLDYKNRMEEQEI